MQLPPPHTSGSDPTELKWCMCASGWKEKDHQHKLQWVTRPVQGVFAPMGEGKTPPMCASGVLVLVDRRITPQVQGAKVRSQGAKVREQHQCKSVRMQQQHSTTTTTTATTDQDQNSMMQQSLQLAYGFCKEFVCPYASCSDCCIVLCWSYRWWWWL